MVGRVLLDTYVVASIEAQRKTEREEKIFFYLSSSSPLCCIYYFCKRPFFLGLITQSQCQILKKAKLPFFWQPVSLLSSSFLKRMNIWLPQQTENSNLVSNPRIRPCSTLSWGSLRLLRATSFYRIKAWNMNTLYIPSSTSPIKGTLPSKKKTSFVGKKSLYESACPSAALRMCVRMQEYNIVCMRSSTRQRGRKGNSKRQPWILLKSIFVITPPPGPGLSLPFRLRST